jgi:hypothetical protein
MRDRETLTRTKLGQNGQGRGTGRVMVVGQASMGLGAGNPSREGRMGARWTTGPEQEALYQTVLHLAPAFDSVCPLEQRVFRRDCENP